MKNNVYEEVYIKLVIDSRVAFATRCDICGRLKVHNFSLFDFAKDKRVELECNCGQPNAVITTKDYKSFWMEIPCFACQDNHVFKYKLKQLLKGNVVTRCIETGMEICFIGNEDDVNKLATEYEEESKELLSDLGFYDYFDNFEVMMEIINRVRKMDEEGKITCECGSEGVEVDLFEDRVELSCLDCDSIHLIYAQTEDDLKNLMKRDHIVMREHGFECIDAINHNNDGKNK